MYFVTSELPSGLKKVQGTAIKKMVLLRFLIHIFKFKIWAFIQKKKKNFSVLTCDADVN